MSVGGPHVLVVGGTRGLGRSVVDSFLQRGCRVTIVSRRAPEGKPAALTAHVAADLETLASADAVRERVLSAAGPLRYMVLCQRYRGEGDVWQGELQVGLTASKILIEGFAEHFETTADCGIGVVSSVYADFVGSSQPVGYHVVKAGLNQMVRHYAWALGRRGIRVNAIMPLSYIKPESRAFYESKHDLMQLYDRFVPLRRMGLAEDSANLLDFLCSDKAAFINGQCIYVDGGVSVVWQEELAKSLAGM